MIPSFLENEIKIIRVVVADNHPTFRQGLCRLLTDEKEFEIVGQASDGEEIVILSKSLQPDVAIVDVSMPKQSGIVATKFIKEASPNTAVLIVSEFNYQSYIIASLRAGAAGYLTKDTPMREIVSAVRLADSGEGIIDRSAANNIIRHMIRDKDGHKRNTELHSREIEVIKLTAKGMRNKEIAKELSISERTVQAHLGKIFTKLDVDSRTEAVLQALKQGWLDICELS
jgi:two-component system, NarL family, response regulator LiaR